jgi:hypothetical protein
LKRNHQRNRFTTMAGTAPGGPDPKLQARQEELANAMANAAQRGDMKAIERLQKEMDAVAKKMVAPGAELDSRLGTASKAAAGRDLYARLTFGVNELWIVFQDNLKGPVKQEMIGGYQPLVPIC